jgi:hypothetical protein
MQDNILVITNLIVDVGSVALNFVLGGKANNTVEKAFSLTLVILITQSIGSGRDY